ncbi:PEP-CTERM protein-sorting domain-containing protein [Rubritalea squalenifaciens DSM 18772]|uniref:PEP-CTERM protein-sorting domain-containing protein n=1 Tax=Rubritalea squalenifaciens DSM 18772 TaxID=1123071 RepID=A0A1M6QX23_9BACT|nr:PEP-CTERM sorting domain-containing protein [Rubritalea squalenifaciens]SHK24638.1 PEP-CTERM protein-sorting domain-containing protein [Rubritalea squalenifaciens DSM 18772]
MKLNTLTATLGGMLMSSMITHGAITFVSVADDLSNISPNSEINTTNSQVDDFWRQRDGFGEGGITVLEAWNDTEDVAILTMTLTGLAIGETYDIYTNYIRFGAGADADGNRGGVRASLNGIDFTTFNGAGGTSGVVGFSELTGHAASDRVGLRGYLGTAVADGSGQIQIFMDDDGLSGGIEERIWLDGASYGLAAVPEPGTSALLGIAGLGMILRRRR